MAMGSSYNFAEAAENERRISNWDTTASLIQKAFPNGTNDNQRPGPVLISGRNAQARGNHFGRMKARASLTPIGPTKGTRSTRSRRRIAAAVLAVKSIFN